MNQRSYMLENEKIKSLLLKLSLPATIAMLVNALYNLVDAIFIGRSVGTLAIGGLSIALPIQMVVMAIALMIGVGAASAISRSLGAKDIEKADYVAGNSFLAIIVLSGITVILGYTFLEPLLRIFGATDSLLPFAKEYMSIIFMGTIFFSFTVASNNLVRAEGNAKTSMFIMLIGTGLNIILDYIFIMVFNYGVKGAAIATILSQFASFVYVMIYLYGGKSTLKVKLHHFRPDISILREIFTVGFSSFARNIVGSLVAIIINNSLRIYGGDIAISIYGVINRVIMFLFMPLFGVIQGMQPIAGFNYGAKKIDRVKEVVRLSIITITTLATIGTLVGLLFPDEIMNLFSKEPELAEQGSAVLRIVICMIPIIGVQIVGATLFQSLGKAIPALIVTLLRQIILLIPLVIILPLTLDNKLLGVWLAFPISDLVSSVISAVLLKVEMRKISLEIEEV